MITIEEKITIFRALEFLLQDDALRPGGHDLLIAIGAHIQRLQKENAEKQGKP